MQVLQLLKELASGDFGATIGPAVVSHGSGMAYTHQPTHDAEAYQGQVTSTVTVGCVLRAKHREPVADHLAGNRLCRQALVPLRYRHEISAVAVKAEDNTVIDFVAMTDGGHGELVDGHILHGDVQHGGPIGVAGL